jgi:hypothetical protein
VSAAPLSYRFQAALLAGAVFVLGVPVAAAVLFLPVVFLAGPHSDLLPGVVQPVVWVAGWLAVVVAPIWVAVRAYRWRLARGRLDSGA